MLSQEVGHQKIVYKLVLTGGKEIHIFYSFFFGIFDSKIIL